MSRAPVSIKYLKLGGLHAEFIMSARFGAGRIWRLRSFSGLVASLAFRFRSQ